VTNHLNTLVSVKLDLTDVRYGVKSRPPQGETVLPPDGGDGGDVAGGATVAGGMVVCVAPGGT